MFTETLGVEKIPVLLVEDATSDAIITTHKLHAVDDEFTVHNVHNLKDALRWIADNKVDAVLLDLGLPDSNGTQGIKTLTGQFPDLPVVVLSGYDDPSTIHTVLESGAQGFLSKSEYSGNTIRQAILGAMVRKSLTKELSQDRA